MKEKTADRVYKIISMSACFVGNSLTIIGCIGLLLGGIGVFDMNVFAIGLSSGVRIIGTVAIAGCLLSAIGYGLADHAKRK